MNKRDIQYSERLRKERVDVQANIEVLENDRSTKSGSEKAAVTRKITPLKKQLAAINAKIDALNIPAAVDPAQAARNIIRHAESDIADIDEAREKWVEERLKPGNVADALAWRGEELVKNDLMRGMLQRLVNAPAAHEDRSPFRAIEAEVIEITNEVDDGIKRTYRVGGSTSPMHNLIDTWKLEFRLDVHARRSWSVMWPDWEVRNLAQHVEVWEVLHADD